MKPIKNINAAFIAPLFTLILLGLTVQAKADWPGAGILSPNVMPNPGQPRQHEVPPVRFEPQHREEAPRPQIQHNPTTVHPQPVPHDRPDNHYQSAERHDINPGYFRRDSNYYGYVQEDIPADVDSGFVVPDGYGVVMVNGETFYYNQGVFYQQVGDQLVVIPPVLGAVVDSIPQDYQIVMADGVHYLFTGGIFYQRVDQGFEVVQGPAPYQG